MALVAGLLGVAGLALVVGPWVFRLASDLSDERDERVRPRSAPTWPRTCTTRCCRPWP